jgi:hypothetical protein
MKLSVFLFVLGLSSFFASVLPQQPSAHADDPFPACAGNLDCMAMRTNENLLSYDDSTVSVKGKKRETRVHTIVTAAIYVSEHLKEDDRRNYYRFFNCVSKGLAAELGLKRTIFSSENIIETYFAFNVTPTGPDGIKFGVQNVCNLLEIYYSNMRQAVRSNLDASEILNARKKQGEPDPEATWHQIQAAFFKERYPTEDADANVAGSERKYCVFARDCRAVQNSPFASRE